MRVGKYSKGFDFVEHDKDLELPLTWKKQRKIFVNSMLDLFHEQASMEFIQKCFFTMIKAHWHTYQVLTKRPERLKEFSYQFEHKFGEKIPSHIWVGTSVENQKYTSRIEELRKVACTIRFISFEPMLDSITDVDLKNIDWAIIGGESGAGFREIKKKRITDLIKECKRQKVAVFFKQWGGFRPKSRGREINGKTYDQYPIISNAQSEKIKSKLLQQVLSHELKESGNMIQLEPSLQ